MTNVYNIIEKSPFFVDVKDFRLYFSSEFNQRRFTKGYKDYIVEERQKFINRYKVSVDLFYPLLLSYYLKIEKRGFRVLRKSDNLSLLKDIKFSSIIL